MTPTREQDIAALVGRLENCLTPDHPYGKNGAWQVFRDALHALRELEAERDEADAAAKCWYAAASPYATPEALQSELAKVRKDAERYRWLRERWGTQMGSATIEWHLPLVDTFGEVDEFDKAIDSAIESAGKRVKRG